MKIENLISKANLESPIDISIPLRFNSAQPNVYDVDPALSKACEYGEFIGDTRRGGSVNFEQYTFIPHCNGTHTECVGHVTDQRIFVKDCLKEVFSEALLITLQPENAINSSETYPFDLAGTDQFITRKQLIDAIEVLRNKTDSGRLLTDTSSLVIRTRPNDDSKLTRSYGKEIPPFFSNEAMDFIGEKYKHLLVDLPSIDRIYDGGKLSNHRIFWNLEPNGMEIAPATRVESTVTELIYVPEQIEDGGYLLNLQITAFESDATPSRPVLFSMV
jgi:hypothetical protein